MDEKVIYIIFIVLSLVYSVYKKKQKQNAQKSIQQPVASNQQQAAKGMQLSDMEQRKAERAAKVKNLLDKMLLGEEFTEMSNTKDEVQVEEEIESKPTINKKAETEIRKQDEVKERYSTITEEDIKPKEIIKPEVPSHRHRINFNLRQAVINSIILERKY